MSGDMLRMQLLRVAQGENGTFGVVPMGGAPWIHTVEQQGNFTDEHPYGVPFHSCVPAGLYRAKRIHSQRFGETFVLINRDLGVYHHEREVEAAGGGRFLCYFGHVGNLAQNVQGCMGLGLYFGELNGLPAVMRSGDAVKEFLAQMAGVNEFELEIIDPPMR